jgi:elongation factor Ts
MTISAQDVKNLRDRTGAGMMDCKNALLETNGDAEAAIDLLRARGAAKAAKRAAKSANEGTIGSYIHFGGKIGVVVELNCETDFVAKTEDFQALAKDLAMHIAAANPIAVRAEDIPADLVERERSIFLEQVKSEGKPDDIAQKIVEGRIRKYFEENTLLQQPFVKSPDKTVEQLVTEVAAKTGERIQVARFSRLQVGGGS